MWRTQNNVRTHIQPNCNVHFTHTRSRPTDECTPYTDCLIHSPNRPKQRSANWKLISFVQLCARVSLPVRVRARYAQFLFSAFSLENCIRNERLHCIPEFFAFITIMGFFLGIGQIHFHNIIFRSCKQKTKAVKIENKSKLFEIQGTSTVQCSNVTESEQS